MQSDLYTGDVFQSSRHNDLHLIYCVQLAEIMLTFKLLYIVSGYKLCITNHSPIPDYSPDLLSLDASLG